MNDKKFETFQPTEEEKKKQLGIIKEAYEDGFLEINGRKYTFTSFNHKTRLSIFAYQSSITGDLQRNNFLFLDTPEWQRIEKLMFERILYNNMQLSKLENHFEEFEGDYLKLVTAAMAVITVPLR